MKKQYNFDPEKLTSEKKLWDVYLLSRKIKISNFNFYFCVAVFIGLMINAHYIDNHSIIIQDIRSFVSFGFTFSITTLGLLIAGFTIFATLAKPEMLLRMMEHKNEKTQIETLKYNFIVFMRVFIHYLITSFIYLFMFFIFGQQSQGVMNKVVHLISIDFLSPYCILNFIYSFTGMTLIYLLLLLKSFIFNIYAIIMAMLRWEYYVQQQGD